MTRFPIGKEPTVEIVTDEETGTEAIIGLTYESVFAALKEQGKRVELVEEAEDHG